MTEYDNNIYKSKNQWKNSGRSLIKDAKQTAELSCRYGKYFIYHIDQTVEIKRREAKEDTRKQVKVKTEAIVLIIISLIKQFFPRYKELDFLVKPAIKSIIIKAVNYHFIDFDYNCNEILSDNKEEIEKDIEQIAKIVENKLFG